MRIVKIIASVSLLAFLVLILAFDIWGFSTLGTITPETQPTYDENANKVVMVLGATGSVGDGLLKAAIDASEVEKVHVITRRTSPRIEEGVASGKVEMHMHEDFTDYSGLTEALAEVDTVLWGLGTTSVGMDDDTYTWIHVDFPVAFVSEWLSTRRTGPMSFHYVTGMGTDLHGEQHWAREKGRAEQELAMMAEGTGLRTFGYRSAFVRPSSERANAVHYLGEVLLRPGSLVITSKQLGQAMLEISERTTELANGTLIDNADSIAYAEAYQERKGP
jgi:hypothetical protein